MNPFNPLQAIGGFTADSIRQQSEFVELLAAAEDVLRNGHQHDVGGGDVFLGTCDSTERLQRAVDALRAEPDDSGMAGPAMAEHDFVVQPASGIEICTHCGISKVGARGNTICDVATTEQP